MSRNLGRISNSNQGFLASHLLFLPDGWGSTKCVSAGLRTASVNVLVAVNNTVASNVPRKALLQVLNKEESHYAKREHILSWRGIGSIFITLKAEAHWQHRN